MCMGIVCGIYWRNLVPQNMNQKIEKPGNSGEKSSPFHPGNTLLSFGGHTMNSVADSSSLLKQSTGVLITAQTDLFMRILGTFQVLLDRFCLTPWFSLVLIGKNIGLHCFSLFSLVFTVRYQIIRVVWVNFAISSTGVWTCNWRIIPFCSWG